MADFVTLELLKTTVVPVAVAGAGSLVSRRLPRALESLSAAVFVTLAYAVAHRCITGDLQLPPREALHWIPLLTALGLLAAMTAERRQRSFPLWLTPVAAITWALLFPLREYYEWDALSMSLWTGGTALVLLLLFGASCTAPPDTAPGVLAIVAGGIAGTAILSHSAKVASLAGALGLALAVFAAASLVRPRERSAWGATAAGSSGLAALLLYAFQYVDLRPLSSVILLLAGWASLYLTAIPALRRLPARRSLVVQSLVAALPVGLAVILASRGQAASPY